jgi:hypothetical protein
LNRADNNWSNRQKILDGSVQFAKSGGKLINLNSRKRKIQAYGRTAIVYSNFSYELEWVASAALV